MNKIEEAREEYRRELAKVLDAWSGFEWEALLNKVREYVDAIESLNVLLKSHNREVDE